MLARKSGLVPRFAGGAEVGFTIVELAVVMVIIAIALALGVPLASEWTQNAQIRTASESVLNGLQAARTEAVRRNATVEFSLVDPGVAGNTGWEIKLPDGTVLQSKPAGEASRSAVITTTPNDSSAYTFSGFGRPPEGALNSDGSAVLTQLDITSGTTPPTGVSWRAMRIQLTNGGDIRMCDPAVTSTSDPRSC